jgi:hypothetical protein
MKSLGEYIAESEREFSQPVRGDYFSINLREETLLETWVCDETPDGIVLHADERAMQLLEEYGYISQPGVAEEGISPTPGSRLDNLNKKTMASYGERLTSLNNKIKNETNPAKIRKLQDRIKQLEREYGIDEGVAEGLGDDTNDYYAGYYVDLLSQTQNMSVTDRVDTKLRIKRALESGELKLVDLKSEIRALDSEIVRTKKGVAEGFEEPSVPGGRWTYSGHQIIANNKTPNGSFLVLKNKNDGKYEIHKQVGSRTPGGLEFVGAYTTPEETEAAFMKISGGVKIGVTEGHDYEADSDGMNVDVIDRGEYDFEGDQARDQLRTIVRAARRLNGIIDDDDNLPEWVQMKITKASDYIDTAADYMQDNKGQSMDEAKYQGREVPLGKPMKGDVKKSKVYVRGPKGNVVKVNFGQKGMKIKKNIPGRRKNFRARHNCDNPGPRWKARYWSCRAW